MSRQLKGSRIWMGRKVGRAFRGRNGQRGRRGAAWGAEEGEVSTGAPCQWQQLGGWGFLGESGAVTPPPGQWGEQMSGLAPAGRWARFGPGCVAGRIRTRWLCAGQLDPGGSSNVTWLRGRCTVGPNLIKSTISTQVHSCISLMPGK